MKRCLQILFMVFGLNISIFLPSFAQNSVPQGLIAYYPFNGNANDVSGSGNNGTVVGALLTTDRFGNANNAYSFNGSSDYISINNPANLPLGNSPRTISVWLNPANWAGEWTLTAVAYGSASTSNAFMFGLGQNIIAVQGWVNDVSSPLVYSINQWINAVCTYDGTNVAIYINGNLIGSGTSISWNTVGTEFYIGGRVSLGNSFFDGKLDDIGIWNRVLTNSEIQKLYLEGESGKTIIQNNAKSILITPDLIQSNSTVTGTGNTFIGDNALKNNRDGSYNTAMGFQAGGMSSGTGNVFVGANAGNVTDFQNTSNKLIIANSTTNNPLIYGEFDNSILKINGKLVIQKNNEVPATSNSAGIQGQIAFDDNYLYICVQTNVWKRFALSSW
ncbi:LamG domain-containing protein [Emticicia sp. C21]|uniref:LamG domain-containing protein n=1 Tax=Emticicia sp. C21 TaxID=2302915 RepID=UPI000E347DDD|nr:LamG domain-containing protein [Emticicia sp. C21]RFS15455.1 LamG domain-containing protein [Emticicia sp. C21]